MGRGKNSGLTLIELLVTLAILGVVMAIAVPLYSNYVQTGREGALVQNIATIEVFQEDFRLRTGSYAAGSDAIADIGWSPQRDDGTTYAIASTDTDAYYEVTATGADGTVVCRRFPDNVGC